MSSLSLYALDSQTLFFSATFPPLVQKIAKLTLLPTHKHVSTISETDIATHEHVDQYYGTFKLEDLYPAATAILSKWISENSQAKIMAFTNTARTAGLLAEMVGTHSPSKKYAFISCVSQLGNLQPTFRVPIFVTHSRLTQSKRTVSMNGFKVAPTAILVTSDVTARGIDVADVTHVLQIGIPSSVEQCKHARTLSFVPTN